ncbi:hypothetical protein ACWCRD_02775 [Streptomyces sp. NPDC002092]
MTTAITPTAPLPAPAVEALARLELAFASPVERLRKQIARLEDSLRIQRDGRDSDLVQMRNPMASELERAEAEGSFRSTAWEIVRLRGQLREYRAALAVALRYEAASAHCRELAAGGDFDGCWAAQDEMAMCKCQLEKAGRLDLIGGAS